MTRKSRARILTAASIALLTSSADLIAQAPAKPPLPDAPIARLIAQSAIQSDTQPVIPAPSAVTGQSPAALASTQPSTSNPRLTRAEAEAMATKKNPRVTVARLLALAQHQVVRETRAAELPTGLASITAVDAENATRISAGSLTSSRLFEHAGAGGNITQLITDFGRTRNLVASSKLQEKAQNANALATTEDIVLATDQAFYNALQAQALLKVAQQAVDTRGLVEHQVDELTKNKLKSTLDLTFAQVNLSQARLLLLDAQNNVDSTIAALTAVLGFDKNIRYELVEVDSQAPPPPPPDVDVLINTALQQRPDLQALTYNQQAAEKFRRAQRDQLLPTISALGIAGASPVRPDCVGGTCNPNYFISSWYGAVGVNMEVPIFNGFLFTASASEAKFRANAARESTRNLHDNVVRDVRTAWLSATNAFQKVGVSAELEKEGNLSLSLAQGRYQMGLSSIVELSQAQLQQTDAAIGYVNAEYQYRLSLSTLNFEIGAQP